MRPGASPQAMERSRSLVERQVKLLTRLTDDLIDLSGIGRGKLSLQEERLDLTRLVRTACEDQRSALEGAELTLSLQVPPEPIWIEGDPTRLMQVVGNLIQAIRAGKPSIALSNFDYASTLTESMPLAATSVAINI